MRYSIESCINYSKYIKEYGFKLYLSVYVGPTSKNSRGHVIDGWYQCCSKAVDKLFLLFNVFLFCASSCAMTRNSAAMSFKNVGMSVRPALIWIQRSSSTLLLSFVSFRCLVAGLRLTAACASAVRLTTSSFLKPSMT